eukprot:3787712-Amphidinium_carterae.1
MVTAIVTCKPVEFDYEMGEDGQHDNSCGGQMTIASLQLTSTETCTCTRPTKVPKPCNQAHKQ